MVKANSIVYVTSGEYSDYDVKGVYIAKKDFEFDQWMEKFTRENPLQEIIDYNKRTVLAWENPKIVEFFVENGLLEKIEAHELHLYHYYHRVEPKEVKLIA